MPCDVAHASSSTNCQTSRSKSLQACLRACTASVRQGGDFAFSSEIPNDGEAGTA